MKSARFDPKSGLSRSMRKLSASFYTRGESALLLAVITITDFHQKICDPACGTGSLLEAAFHRKKQLMEQDLKLGGINNRNSILDDLYGVEIIPDAAKSTQNRLLKLASTINISDKNSKTHKVFSDDAINHEFPPADVILLNPPFTKKQLLKPTNRMQLEAKFVDYYQQKLLNARSSLISHFLCLGDIVLHQNGIHSLPHLPKCMGVVLPASFLCSFEDINLRKFILDHYWVKAIILREDRANFSEDTELQEILVIFEESHNQKKQYTTYIFISEINENNAMELGNNINQFINGPQNPMISKDLEFSISQMNKCIYLQVHQNHLDPRNIFLNASLGLKNLKINQVWLRIRQDSCFFSIKEKPNVKIESKNAAEPQGTGLSFKTTTFLTPSLTKDSKDLCIIDTSAKSFEITIKTSLKRNNTQLSDLNRISIEKENCFPGFRYVTKKNMMDVSQIDEYILVSAPRTKYLNHISLNSWQIWQKYTKARQSRLILTDRSNLIRPGVHHLAFYSNIPRIIARSAAAILGLEDTEEHWFTLWFNSSWGILEWIIQRVPQQFMYCQHHKYTLERLILPNFSKFSTEDRQQIEHFYRNISVIPFPSILDQYLRILSDDTKIELELTPIRSKLPASVGKGFLPRIELDNFIGGLLAKYLSTETWSYIYQNLNIKQNQIEKLTQSIQLAITQILINAFISSKKKIV